VINQHIRVQGIQKFTLSDDLKARLDVLAVCTIHI